VDFVEIIVVVLVYPPRWLGLSLRGGRHGWNSSIPTSSYRSLLPRRN
jgi:hypothetical protein